MNRRVTVSAIVIVVALSVGGCAEAKAAGDGTQGVHFSENAPMSSTTMKVMGFSISDEIGQTRYDLASKAISPAKVSLSQGQLDMQAFLSAVSAGTSPDAIYLQRNQVGTLAAKGILMPLDTCVQGEGIKTSDFNKAALAQVTFNGHIYAIPEFNQVQFTFANSQLLAKAGLSIDDVNGRNGWGAIEKANKALTVTKHGRLTTLGYDPKLPEFLPLWAKANGADVISADGKTAELDSPKMVQALQFAVKLYDEQGGFAKAKSTRDSADFWGSGNQFASNTLGAMNMEQWYADTLQSVTPKIPIEFSPFYVKGTDQPIAYATGSGWAIPATASNKPQACRFIKTMTETSSWIQAAKVRVGKRKAAGEPFTGLLTGNDTADAQIRQMVTPTGSPVWDHEIQVMYTADQNLFYTPPNPADSEFTSAWQDAVNRVLDGDQSPAQALKQAQHEAQTALDNAWKSLEAREG